MDRFAVAKALLAEHSRAVMVVKKLEKKIRSVKATGREAGLYRAGALQACADILAALQRGRTK